MIVASFSYKGRKKIKKIDKNVKINSKCYQEHVLTPVFKYEIPDFYSHFHQCIELHQDKASSHALQSAIAFLKKNGTRNEN